MKALKITILFIIFVPLLLSGCENPTCEKVEISPTSDPLGGVPVYEGAEESSQKVLLDENSDPFEYRCEMAYVFNDNFPDGALWKHYITTDEPESACDYYEQRMKEVSWSVTYTNCAAENKVILGKKSGQSLLVLFPISAEKTDVLVGLEIE